MTKRWAMYAFFACFVVTYLVSVPLSLMFESPILQIERLILFPEKVKEKKEEKQKLNDKEFEALLPVSNEYNNSIY